MTFVAIGALRVNSLHSVSFFSSPEQLLGPVVQSVASQTAEPGVMSSIPLRPHTFVEIDHEIISMVILHLLIQEGLLSVTSKGMCVEYWLIA